MKQAILGVHTGISLKCKFRCFVCLNRGVNLSCWMYSVGSGSWVTDGVRTTNNTMVRNVTSVQCLSTHLTSFAVLVDVAGGLQVCCGCPDYRCSFVLASNMIDLFFFLIGHTRGGAQSLTDSFIHWMCHLYNLPHHFRSILHNARVWHLTV